MYATLCMGPAPHSPVAPIATHIPSSNAGESDPRTNDKCGNYYQLASSVPFGNQLAPSPYSVGFILPRSRSTIGFTIREFHTLISRQRALSSWMRVVHVVPNMETLCIQRISSVNVLHNTQIVPSQSGRFGGDHIGWSQLQLASSVSPLW